MQSFLFSLLDLLETPAFFVDHQRTIGWRNSATKRALPCVEYGIDWGLICNELPGHFIYRLHECTVEGNPGMLVECIPSETPHLLDEINTLQAANRELESVFNILDELFITDGNGIMVRINESTERMYGVRREELLGRSVYDLERERLFYPSVTAIVLRVKHAVTILQKTKEGRQLVVTGYPVFSEQGAITRVVTNANDITSFEMQQILKNSEKTAHLLDEVDFITESTAMRHTVDLAQRVAKHNVSVLLLGETGVGKNRMARLIHQGSKRKSGPFVEINCAAIPESLLESELFGYERGAFTGARREGKPGKAELAKRGTLFLNEIGELPLALQSKLLDFIQEKQFSRIGGTKTYSTDIRIIAATNQNLEKMVSQGRFREDLYYRLNVFPIVIPPLRERKEDISRIAESWLSACPSCQDGPAKFLHPDTIRLMSVYSWPGNIRELENTLERMAIIMDEPVLLPQHLPHQILHSLSTIDSSQTEQPGSTYPSSSVVQEFFSGPVSLSSQEAIASQHSKNIYISRSISEVSGFPNIPLPPNSAGQSLPARLEQFEKLVYEQSIKTCKTTYEVAKSLGVSQPTVVRKLKYFGLSMHRL